MFSRCIVRHDDQQVTNVNRDEWFSSVAVASGKADHMSVRVADIRRRQKRT